MRGNDVITLSIVTRGGVTSRLSDYVRYTVHGYDMKLHRNARVLYMEGMRATLVDVMDGKMLVFAHRLFHIDLRHPV